MWKKKETVEIVSVVIDGWKGTKDSIERWTTRLHFLLIGKDIQEEVVSLCNNSSETWTLEQRSVWKETIFLSISGITEPMYFQLPVTFYLLALNSNHIIFSSKRQLVQIWRNVVKADLRLCSRGQNNFWGANVMLNFDIQILIRFLHDFKWTYRGPSRDILFSGTGRRNGRKDNPKTLCLSYGPHPIR